MSGWMHMARIKELAGSQWAEIGSAQRNIDYAARNLTGGNERYKGWLGEASASLEALKDALYDIQMECCAALEKLGREGLLVLSRKKYVEGITMKEQRQRGGKAPKPESMKAKGKWRHKK